MPAETTVGCTTKSYDVPIGFVPHSCLRQCIALFETAEGWLLLDKRSFVLLLYDFPIRGLKQYTLHMNGHA